MSGALGKHYADFYPGTPRPKKLWLKALEPKAREQLCAAQLPAARQAGLAAHAGVRCVLKTTSKKIPKDPAQAADENLTRYFITSWEQHQKSPPAMAQIIPVALVL